KGLPPLEEVRGSVALDSGRLQRSTLTAKWLGGPLTLRISERRDAGASRFLIRAQGLADSRELLALTVLENTHGSSGTDVPPANISGEMARAHVSGDVSGTHVSGEVPWNAELSIGIPPGSEPVEWRAQAEGNFVSVSSNLPQPLGKAAGSPLTLRIESTGSDRSASLHVALSDRLRSELPLGRAGADGAWGIEKGAVRSGRGRRRLPADAGVRVEGRIDALDLPAWARLWRLAQEDSDRTMPLLVEVEAASLV